jgi:hypothetical protein
MFQHKHVYVYQFEMKNHSTWHGTHVTTMEYTLCTNDSGPNSKSNRKLLGICLKALNSYMKRNDTSSSNRKYKLAE